ncbi:MAG TPA: mechanosensitive ion channel domain-containing protein [Chitinophagaceae bacterium]|nr:mechanosensitive ion channel domain-containing protein [Chitinophagaceae bacterium]
MNEFWSNEYLGISLSKWIAVAVIITTLLAANIVNHLIKRKHKMQAEKNTGTFSYFLKSMLRKTLIPLLTFIIIYYSVRYLVDNSRVLSVMHTIMLLLVSFFVLRTLSGIIHFIVLVFFSKQEDGDLKQKQAGGLITVIKGIIWIMGAVFVLNNLGYNVTTIIAGLGIGGIAIALAAQTILGDLFSYFVILFDRPFEIGDFIIVDSDMGVVEYIGIKTTRLRTLSGEQLICSNKALTDARVHNFKRMEKRRVVFSIGVTYQAEAAMLRKIPKIVENIITAQQDVTFDRGHFSAFGPSSLNFEFVYYILSSDYNMFMDRQQAIYLEIFSAFEKNNIDFAYPTSTVFVNNQQVPENHQPVFQHQ